MGRNATSQDTASQSEYIGKVIIEGRLAGLNELIAVNRAGWKSGSKDKKAETNGCMAWAKYAMQHGLIKPIKVKADVSVTWYEKSAKRDHDNILGGGLKMAFDGFVKAGLLADDSQRYIGKITSIVKKSPTKPRIEFEFYRSEE